MLCTWRSAYADQLGWSIYLAIERRTGRGLSGPDLIFTNCRSFVTVLSRRLRQMYGHLSAHIDPICDKLT